jgi:integrase
VSLGSKSVLTPGVAEKFWEASREYDRLYVRAVKTKEGDFDKLAAHDIAFLAEAFRSETLGDDDTARWDPAERELHKSVAAQLEAAGIAYTTPWAGRESIRWASKHKDTVEASLATCRAMRAAGDLEAIVEWWREEAVDFAEARGYVLDPSDTRGIAELCRALNDGSISAGADMLARLDGSDYPETPPEPVCPKVSDASARPQATTGQTFREIVEGVLDDPLNAISVSTRAQVSTALRYLVDVLGDLRPEELTAAEVTRWLSMIAKRPAFVSAKEREMPLGELVALYEGQEYEKVTQATLKKHCQVLSTRWSHAAGSGLISEALRNPFYGRKFKVGRSPVEGFSADELRGIFSLPHFASGEQPTWGRGEAAYWLPLLALYTGARPEEIAQLVLSDIFEDRDTGRTVLSFEGTSMHPEKGQQRLKTEEKGTGPRTFPLPDALISLGFLDYVTWLRAQGEDALFPALRVRNKFNKLFPSFSEKWAEAIYSREILKRRSRRQPFREFRHTFTTGARISGIPEEAIGYILGHTTAGANQPRMTRTYGKLSPYAQRIAEYRPLLDVLELVKPWRVPE